jgi:protein required for attachment to host cells
MSTTWVVVGHRAGARILEHTGPGKGLRLVSDLDNPEGRLKSGQMDTDKPGTSFSSGPGPGRHPMSPQEDSHHHVAENFAAQIAVVLGTARVERRFDQVVLVAEPGFLGMMRSKLDASTTAMVKSSLGKDLANVRLQDLGKHLGSVLAV